MEIFRFNNWSKINEETSARLPKDESYWVKKGKSGKQVALYTHDDMDGIFSAIEVKKYLINAGFTIVKYGVLNYTDGWRFTTLDPKLINVVVDFANMPGDERDDMIDYYLDHHGSFTQEDLEKYKNSPVQKKKTGSAYEAICQSLGVPQDSLIVSVIDMIDSAKYDFYEVDWSRLLKFDISDIKKSKNKRLEFAAALNQFLKRSDTKTLIAVIENCKDASIYAIFNTFKILYPEHNIDRQGNKKGFVEDSTWRLGEMKKRVLGKAAKQVYNSQGEFLAKFQKSGFIQLDGYQIIGDLAFIPTGTWANAPRVRPIMQEEFQKRNIPAEPKFILLQYGGTLQVCSYKKIEEYGEELPRLKNGENGEVMVLNDLGAYMTGLLKNFQKHLGYFDPETSAGQDDDTVAGGHSGIGSISNIKGTCRKEPYVGQRFVDMFKNKIISDLSGIPFNLNLKWSEPKEFTSKDPEMDYKVIGKEDVTKVSPTGRILRVGDIGD